MADTILDDFREWQPGLVSLARLASVATIVEPVLLRRLRLELLPALDAGAEADLWFSPLVGAASSSALTFGVEVARSLRAELSDGDPLARSARRIVEDVHQQHSDLIKLEEEVIWASIRHDSEAVEAAMQRVVATIAADPAAAADVLRWFLQARRRMPSPAVEVPSGRELLTLSALFLDLRVPPGLIGSDGFSTGAARLAPSVPTMQITIELDGTGLRFGAPSPSAPSAGAVEVPATIPPVLEVRWEGGSLVVDASPGSITLPGIGLEAVVRSLVGRRYRLTATPTPLPNEPTRRRQLIALINSRYDDDAFTDLPELADEWDRLATWLGDQQLGDRRFTRSVLDPGSTPAEIMRRLVEPTGGWSSDDAVMIYLSGHGVVTGDGRFLMPLAHSRNIDLPATALDVPDLLRRLRDSALQNFLLILDASFANAAFTEFLGTGRKLPPGWVLIASADSLEYARTNGFAPALQAAVDSYDPGGPFFTPAGLTSVVQRHLTGQTLVTRFGGDPDAPHVCLPNPHYVSEPDLPAERGPIDQSEAVAVDLAVNTGAPDPGRRIRPETVESPLTATVVAIPGEGGRVHTSATRGEAILDGLSRAGVGAATVNVSTVTYGHILSRRAGPSTTVGDVESLSSTDREVVAEATAQLAEISTEPAGFVSRLIRTLDSRFGAIAAPLLVGTLRQMRLYLTDEALKNAIDEHISESMGNDSRILIGHSLGSVVAFEYVRQHPGHEFDLFMTTGCMLGLNTVRSRLVDPAYGSQTLSGIPANVRRWVNLRDPRDPVAAAGDLSAYWPGIVDQVVDNGSAAHDALAYLSSEAAGRALLEAVSPSSS